MPKRKMTPAEARVRVTAAKTPGFLVGGALRRLADKFTPVESASEFAAWRANPVSVLFLDALRELSRNPYRASVEHDDVLVEYGLTSGLQLSADILDDPSQVFPSLFGGATLGADDPLVFGEFTGEPPAEK